MVASTLASGLDVRDLQSANSSYSAQGVYAKTKQANRMLCAEAAASLSSRPS